MDIAPKKDLASEPRISNEPYVAFEMEATLRKDDVGSVDDVSKIETAPETRVMSDPDVNTPIRKLQRKPHVNRQKRHPVMILASKRDTSENKFEQNIDETKSDSDEDVQNEDSRGSSFAANRNSPTIEDAIKEPAKTESSEGPFTEKVSLTKEQVSSTLESETSKLDQESVKEGASKTRAEEPCADGGSRTQKRKAKDSLKNFIERKIDFVERIVEDRVERFSGKIWEENLERHPWLQPIDTWIADHRKPSSSYTFVTHCQRDDDQRDVASKSTNCETIKEAEEPRVDDKTTEHPREPRGTDSSRSNRLDLASLIAQSKKQKALPTFRVEYREEDVWIDVSNKSTDVGDAKEAKRYNNDLLDKLKDNVKEKMEDIHRVVVQAILLHLFHRIASCLLHDFVKDRD